MLVFLNSDLSSSSEVIGRSWQVTEASVAVLKEETSTRIYFCKLMHVRCLTTTVPFWTRRGRPKEKHFAILKGFNLFNVEQCEGLPEEIASQWNPAEAVTFDLHEEADGLIEASGARIDHVEGDRAFYSPILDRIQLPAKHQFASADRYYSTALHELVHWTGHRSRLNREAIQHWTGFGSEAYAFEELIAEMGMAFLCGHAGVAANCNTNATSPTG